MNATPNRDIFMRRVLWAGAAFNLGGALLFAFPSGPLGQLIGLPAPVPGIYCALLAFLVLLFGFSYLWLARQPIIHRPFLAFSAYGKFGVFCIVVAFWIAGKAPGRGVLAATGDLLFAAVFAWWLRATSNRPE
jgi:hypothetical protein